MSRFTVELAYEQLVSEGYIQARAGSGFFVCDLSNLFSGITGGEQLGIAVSQAVDQQPDIRIDFSPFAIDAVHFPYKVWNNRRGELMVEY